MAVLFPPGDDEPSSIYPANGRTFTLAELQHIVGGYIEVLRTLDGYMIINEEGKLDRPAPLPYNFLATSLMRGLRRIAPDDYIVGHAIVCTPLEAGAHDDEDD